ncbi:hypothetical protein TNCV_2906021 [Trichonephila clavipes]|nr:hypothetical protein TNCV_2906021 [Trichonephila clavipes]
MVVPTPCYSGHRDSAGLSIGRLGRAPRGPDKLDFTRFSGYKFRSTSAKVSSKSSVPRTRNELKLAFHLGHH